MKTSNHRFNNYEKLLRIVKDHSCNICIINGIPPHYYEYCVCKGTGLIYDYYLWDQLINVYEDSQKIIMKTNYNYTNLKRILKSHVCKECTIHYNCFVCGNTRLIHIDTLVESLMNIHTKALLSILYEKE